MAIMLAQCSGRYEAMAEYVGKGGLSSTVEAAMGNARGYMAAAWIHFSMAYDPEGKKPYGEWEELTESHAYGAKNRMAPLPEVAGVIDTSKQPEEILH